MIKKIFYPIILSYYFFRFVIKYFHLLYLTKKHRVRLGGLYFKEGCEEKVTKMQILDYQITRVKYIIETMKHLDEIPRAKNTRPEEDTWENIKSQLERDDPKLLQEALEFRKADGIDS